MVVCSGRVFIGRRGSGRHPEVGVWRRATGRCRMRRLWDRAGMRGLVLWCCHEHAGVLDRAEERWRDGGSGLFLLLYSRSHDHGLGREDGESTAERLGGSWGTVRRIEN
jgi:hypothetical protein